MQIKIKIVLLMNSQHSIMVRNLKAVRKRKLEIFGYIAF